MKKEFLGLNGRAVVPGRVVVQQPRFIYYMEKSVGVLPMYDAFCHMSGYCSEK